MKKIGGTRGKVSHQTWQVGGWFPPEKTESHHFEKFVDCMVLKLTVYIKMSFSSLISQKPSEIPIFRTFYSEIFEF